MTQQNHTKPKLFDILHPLDWRKKAILDGSLQNRDLDDDEMSDYNAAVQKGFSGMYLSIQMSEPTNCISVNDLRRIK